MRALTFGPPVFETPIARIEPDAEVLFGLLLYVSAADPRGVSRDELSRIIWPSATTEQGRHSLRQALYRLRQLGVPIHLRAGLVSIEENDTEIDLRELLHGPIDRSELVRIGTQSFLPGYSPQLGRAYLEWVDELRDRAASVRRRALAAAIVDARAQARFGDIPELARALLALDPLNETATLSLAEALVMDGSKVDALMLLDRYESEVGEISDALRIPVRTLRRRVSEGMDDALMPLRFEVPFVGRVREFGELRDAWAGTRRHVGQCAVVTGEAGIGKTRTSTELLRLAVLDGGLVVTYSCGAGDTVAPLSSLLGLTGMLLNQPGALGCGQEHLNYLRRLLHPDPQQPLSTGMTADLAYAQLVYSLSELVAAITEEAPLVIFIDDAHRLHQTSWRIFTDVTNRLPERSLLLLLAARQLPEFYPTLGITSSDGRVRHVRLPSMGYADAELFLERWSERNRVPFAAEELARFATAAAGNPFYLGELAAHRGRGGADDAPPATIRGLIELQFAALREHAQRVLLVVSLLQTHATLERVTRVLELTPMEFLSALEELEQAGLVKASGATLSLRHDTVGDVCKDLFMPGGLAFLSARAALELESGATGDDRTALLGSAVPLWEQIGEVERASIVLCTLGRAQLESGLFDDAESSFSRALAGATSARTRNDARLGLLRTMRGAMRWHSLAATDVTAEPLDSPGLEAYAIVAEAKYWAQGILPNATMLARIFGDSSLAPSVRALALQLALTVWDNSGRSWQLPCKPEELTQTIDSLGEESASSVSILAYTALRDQQRALKCVDLSLRRLETVAPGHRLRTLRFAAYALTTFGETRDALNLFLAALAAARQLRTLPHQALAASMCARLATHLDSREVLINLRAWCEETAASCALDPISARYHLSAITAIGWALQDTAMLASAAATFASLSAATREAEPTTYHLVEGMLADMGLAGASSELHRWIDFGGHGLFSRGCSDHVVVALVRLLFVGGEHERARLVWRNYLTEQRVESDAPTATILARLPEPLAHEPCGAVD